MKYINNPYFLLLAFTVIVFTACQRSFEYDVEDIPYFEGLSAPATGEGYQIHIKPFPIVANYEREIFLRMPIGNTEDIYVSKFEALCRPGTHHLIAYGYEDENDENNAPIGVMRDQNLADGRGNFSLTMGSGAMYCGAQEPDFVSEFPKGVAVKIPANSTIDMNSHYFNLTNETLFGEVYLNMHTIPKDSVTELLVIDDIDNDENLFLPANETTDIEYTEIFDEETQIRQMFSHMHKRGVLFEVFKVGGSNDGEILYTALDYQHPPYKFFDTPLVFKAGEGIRTKVRYINDTDRDIMFGVTSEDEMGILFYSEIVK
ncbi:MAG: hypothetical protein ACPG19_03955 [Saprospiraceae bacterium]